MLVNEEVIIQYAHSYPLLCQRLKALHDYILDNQSVSHSRIVEGFLSDLLTRIDELNRLSDQYEKAVHTSTEDLLKAMNYGANEAAE